MHWIVARIGLTETILILFGGIVWLVYMVWTRQAKPPHGIWRWGLWLPMLYCVIGVGDGLLQHWEFIDLMTAAGALTEPQKELFVQRAFFGAFKLLLVGTVGTMFMWMTIKRPGNPPISTNPKIVEQQ